ncbi:MAG: BufA1 family periplasmic bufferin-type metallophore [Thermodesulfobacteriota bacterium]
MISFKKGATLAGVASALLMISVSANAVPDSPTSWEKCAGIAKEGKNDCGSIDGKHDCAGHASKSGDSGDWVFVPAGTCGKIVGGKVAEIVKK